MQGKFVHLYLFTEIWDSIDLILIQSFSENKIAFLLYSYKVEIDIKMLMQVIIFVNRISYD